MRSDPDVMNKVIADVQFMIEYEPSFLIEEPEPYQHAFVSAGNQCSTDRDVIHLRLAVENIPDMKGATRVFDSGQAWSWYQDGAQAYLVMKSITLEQPLWLAHIHSGGTQIIVYCNEYLVRSGKGRRVLVSPFCYPLDQLVCMYVLAQRQGAIIHAAGVRIADKAYMFAGRSGAGKSTLTRQFAARQEMGLLSDDRIVVRKKQETFYAYGTPWPGEAGIAVNASAPLAGIFFLAQGTANTITALGVRQALERLLPVTSIPWYDREVVPKMFAFCEDVMTHVPTYELSFTPDRKVVEVVEQFVAT